MSASQEKDDTVKPTVPNDSSSGSRSPAVEKTEDAAPEQVFTPDGKRILQESECYDKLG